LVEFSSSGDGFGTAWFFYELPYFLNNLYEKTPKVVFSTSFFLYGGHRHLKKNHNKSRNASCEVLVVEDKLAKGVAIQCYMRIRGLSLQIAGN
jgi:hypothetical protein